MQHTVNMTLTIEAANWEAARAIAVGATEHLADTFNDDGSVVAAHVEDAAQLLIPANFPPAALHDILINACDNPYGSVRYWCDIRRCFWDRKTKVNDDESLLLSFEADVQEGPVACDHPEIEAAEIGRFTCDHTMLLAGIKRLLAPGAQISPAIRNDVALAGADPEHILDADATDAIVQFAVFGELVFG